MNKSKTTKPAKKLYSSVKELLEDNNSKIKLTPFNCKEVKFGKRVSLNNPYGFNGKIDVIFKRASTSQKFFEGIGNQLPNQILWNEEEQQAYFLNSDKQLYKILFEPFIMKKQKTNQITEEYMESLRKGYLKKEIENIAIPWSRFYVEGCHYRNILNVHLLKPLFIDLLDLIKEKTIKVRCGVGMMQIINENFIIADGFKRSYDVGSCEIIPELDFNLAKFDMVYDDICIAGKGVTEPDIDYSSCNSNEAFKKVAQEVCPPKKNIWQRIFG